MANQAPPNAKDKFTQGYYVPQNPHKCINQKCIYRSSYELKFFRWCDLSSAVVRWGSENMTIPYMSPLDNKWHKYYPDGYMEVRSKTGQVGKYLVEIKPEAQTVAPKVTKRKRQKTILHEQSAWVVNNAKWAAAQLFCKSKGMQFLIMTEKHLQI